MRRPPARRSWRSAATACMRPIAAALRNTDSAVALIPCGRGNDFARVLGIPSEPAAAARVAVEGAERLVDVANVDGTPFVGIASFGFDSDANRIANDTKRISGNAVYLYAALRALAAWKPAAFSVTVDGSLHEATGFSVVVGNSKAYGGGMYVLPQAELDDGRLDVLIAKEHIEADLPARAPEDLQGRALNSPHAVFLRGELDRGRDRPPVRHLRRRRPDRGDAGDPGGGAALSARDRAGLMYRAARSLARLYGPRAAASGAPVARPPPGGCCCASRRARSAHGGRARRGLRAGIRDERQDDDRRHDRRRPRGLRAASSSTTGRARTWHGAWRPRCWTPVVGPVSWGSSRSTRRGSGASRATSSRGSYCSPTCSATSSTATASSSCSPTAGRRSVVGARRPRRLRPQRRRPARRRSRPRPGAGHLLRARRRLADAARDAARGRLEALPQLRPPV